MTAFVNPRHPDYPSAQILLYGTAALVIAGVLGFGPIPAVLIGATGALGRAVFGILTNY